MTGLSSDGDGCGDAPPKPIALLKSANMPLIVPVDGLPPAPTTVAAADDDSEAAAAGCCAC